jgi:hypothetical protein
LEVDKQLDRKLRNSPEAKAARLLKAKEACEQRRQRFLQSLTPYIPRFGVPFINAFGSYWTEPNQDGTKMRFEMTKTWSLEIRLATWERNELKFGNKKAATSSKPVKEDDEPFIRAPF